MADAAVQKPKMRPDILLHSGNYFDFLNPQESRFFVTDIAHALSNICRFGGHTREFYSVAQHSVEVSLIVPETHRMGALFHDGGEAFIGDMPKPLKELLPDYKEVEARIEPPMFAQLGIELPLDPCIKHADRVLLATEQRDLMPHHSDEWLLIRGIAPLEKKIVPLPPREAYQLFMARYAELIGCDVKELL